MVDGRLRVRQAVLADLDRLAPLFDDYRRFQGRSSDPIAAARFLEARFDHGESVVFLAFDGKADGGSERALGFAQLYPSFSSVSLARVFVLNDLFVHQDGRRRGVATALLDAVEAHGRALGAVRLSLSAVRGNAPARALYEARGWAPDEEFVVYHRYPQE